MAKRCMKRESAFALAVIVTISCLAMSWAVETRLALSEVQKFPLSFKEPSTNNQGSATKQKQEFAQLRESAPLERDSEVLSSESIVFNYRIIGRVTVKDDSSNGLSKEEARQALQTEAFRHFGFKAKGITNITYKQKEDALTEPAKFSGASGDVVTWGDGTPTLPEKTKGSLPHDQIEPGAIEAQPTREAAPRERELFEAERPDLYASPSPEPALQKEPTAITSPAGIVILSNEELIGRDFWVLGRVTAHIDSEGSAGVEEAYQVLREEAFKRYGGQARGIINATFKKERGPFLVGSKISEASGDVVTWETRKAADTRGPSTTPPRPVFDASASRPVSIADDETRSPMDIQVLSSNDLLTMNFVSLGSVAVRNSSKEGFTEPHAINSLKIEAFRRYGGQVRGLANIDYKREMTLLHGSIISEAFADAVSWNPGEQIYQSKRGVSTAPPYSYQDVGEASPAHYTNRTVRAGQIEIIKEDEAPADTYRELGEITVAAESRNGFTRAEANRALRKRAFEEFRGEAWGIIHVDYEEAQCLQCNGKYISAKGTVVSR